MFEDSLIESGGKLKTSRPATAVFSFGMQALIVGILVLMPLLFTEALPRTQATTFLVAPPPPPPLPAAVRVRQNLETDMVNNQLRTPTRIPRRVEMIRENETQPSQMGVVGALPDGPPGNQLGVIRGIISNPAVAVLSVPTVTRVRVSQGVTQGMLIHRVRPAYPQMAKIARVQGPVVLAAIVGKEGTIQNLHVLSTASPLLNQAAIEAVKQWRYKPYILNDTPVEVDTQITVNFTLSGS
jgi:protein TonB